MDDREAAETTRELCMAGDLSWMLDDHQLLFYDHFRGWEERSKTEPKKGIARVYMFDAGRQVGKTFASSLIRAEDALQTPNGRFLIASATEIGLKELVIPVLNTIFAAFPDDIRPQFFTSRWGMRAGFFFPTSDAVMKLVGIDKDPDGLRGPRLNGCNITEAAFVTGLAYALGSVIYPQFQREPDARCILESSAPKDTDHDFDRVFLPDCKARGAYYFMTIDDNTAIDEETKHEFVEAARRIDPDDAEREYYGKRIRNRMAVVVPEFQPADHVVAFERPRHAIAMAAMDPGFRDLFAVLWAYWDYERAKLCVESDYCERNASTAQVADVIKARELELYGPAGELYSASLSSTRGFGIHPPAGLCYWNGKEYMPNPILRVSDTEARTIGDLCVDHKIGVVNTFKDDKEAALNALRFAFREKKIEIHPRCLDLQNHLFHARWNKNRTDYERTPAYGHYDLLDALVYLWRMVQPYRAQDPRPPAHIDRADVGVLFPEALMHRPPERVSHPVSALRKAFGTGRRSAWR